VEGGATFQFSGFLSRDQAYDILFHLHKLAKAYQREQESRAQAASSYVASTPTSAVFSPAPPSPTLFSSSPSASSSVPSSPSGQQPLTTTSTPTATAASTTAAAATLRPTHATPAATAPPPTTASTSITPTATSTTSTTSTTVLPAPGAPYHSGVRPLAATGLRADVTAVKYSAELAEVQERFRVPTWEPLMEHYSCALDGASGQGRLYLTKHHLCYYADMFGRQTRLQVPLLDVEQVSEQTGMLGGSIVLRTRTDRYQFKRLPSRTECLQVLTHLWQQERTRPAVFRRPLVATLAREHSDVPAVLRACVDRLSRDRHSLCTDGLFRISPSRATLGLLTDAIDDGCVPVAELLQQANEHLVAGVLKQYLRELPQPLLSFELYDLFITVMALPDEVRVGGWVFARV
jgi:RhoGAP domain/GRAM domain